MSRDAVRSFLAVLAASLLVTAAGCGPRRPETAPVSGRVTYQGKPVTAGRIVFQSEKGHMAVGTIVPDGSYRLTTFAPGDGAMLGHYRVTVEAVRATGGSLPTSLADEARARAAAQKPRVELLVPESYSELESTPLTAEVKPGPNTIDFNLPVGAGGYARTVRQAPAVAPARRKG